MRSLFVCFAFLFSFASFASDQVNPIVDAHLHLRSPASVEGFSSIDPVTARQLVAEMDASGVRHGIALGFGFFLWFQAEGSELLRRVEQENDYTINEVQQFSDRLTGLCSFPLLPNETAWMLEEMERCQASGLRGLKLHLASQGIDLGSRDNKDANDSLIRVLTKARNMNWPVLIHPRIVDQLSWESFLFAAISSEADVVIAHSLGKNFRKLIDLTGFGFGIPRNLHLDLSVLIQNYASAPPAVRQEIVWTLKVLGSDRILFGSDAPDLPIGEALEALSEYCEGALGKYGFSPSELIQVRSSNAIQLFGLR